MKEGADILWVSDNHISHDCEAATLPSSVLPVDFSS